MADDGTSIEHYTLDEGASSFAKWFAILAVVFFVFWEISTLLVVALTAPSVIRWRRLTRSLRGQNAGKHAVDKAGPRR